MKDLDFFVIELPKIVSLKNNGTLVLFDIKLFSIKNPHSLIFLLFFKKINKLIFGSKTTFLFLYYNILFIVQLIKPKQAPNSNTTSCFDIYLLHNINSSSSYFLS